MPAQFLPPDWSGVLVPPHIATVSPGKGGEDIATISAKPLSPQPRKISERLETLVTVSDLIVSFDGRPAISDEQNSDMVNCSFPALQ